jgi:hypothetical protein
MAHTTLTLLLHINPAFTRLTALVDGAVVYERLLPLPAERLYQRAAATGVDAADVEPVDPRKVDLSDLHLEKDPIGLEQDGLEHFVYDNYMKLSVELRDIQAVNVVISGDVGRKDAIAVALQAELGLMLPDSVALTVTVAD